MDFPPWFSAIARLYETYEVHSMRVEVIPSYNDLANGLLTVSYNTNPDDKEPDSPEEMLAQFRSRQERVSRSFAITIPGSVFARTPSRRFTAGPQSFLFHADIWVAAETIQPITIRLTYDVTFHTPQIRDAEPTKSVQYTRANGINHWSGLDSSVTGRIGTTVNPGESFNASVTGTTTPGSSDAVTINITAEPPGSGGVPTTIARVAITAANTALNWLTDTAGRVALGFLDQVANSITQSITGNQIFQWRVAYTNTTPQPQFITFPRDPGLANFGFQGTIEELD